MKFSKTTGLLALGLAGGAVADWPADDGVLTVTGAASDVAGHGGPGFPPLPTSTTTVTATTTVTNVSTTTATTTTTKTETLTKEATTVYRSTVFVAPGFCTSTVVNVDGRPFPPGPPPARPTGSVPAGGNSPPPAPAAPTGSAPAGNNWQPASPAPVDPATTKGAGGNGAPPAWPAGGVTTTVTGDFADPGVWGHDGQPTTGTKTIVTTVIDPSAPTAANWIDWANEVSTVGNNGDVWKWTGGPPAATNSGAAPTYTGAFPSGGPKGNGTSGGSGGLPTPGSPSSNVTAPILPLPEGSCNTAADRSKWCGGQTIKTDAYTAGYKTGNTCNYEFTITNTTMDFDGSGSKLALAINGQVPGPTIECNWGDILQVTVHNKMQDNSTTIHWHGITQKGSNDQDGVPGITECAIAPGSSRTYTMWLEQFGTGWYHSHSLAQYGDGIRGPMIIHGPATANYDYDMGTVMIDDTFPVTAEQQKERISHFGPSGTVNYLLNGHNTKADLSAGQHTLWSVKPGKKHLFRIINSASQNMYSVHFDNHKITVISADYVPLVPYTTEWLNVGIGQRYTVIVEMNQPVAGYFLRAVTQTGCPSGCQNTGLGNANGIFLYEGAQPYLPTSTAGGKTIADFNICADEPLASLVPYVPKAAGTRDQFSATVSTLPAGNVAQVDTSDDGRVFRWFLNNGAINVNYTQPTLQTLAQGGNSSLISNPIILSSAGKWYYFIIQNQFFASHPMHLHGHDMSVLGQGTVAWNPSLVSTLNFDNPTRRDTAMLAGSAGPGAPPGYTVIGFETDNPGAWLMHCHIVWHVDGGLALQWVERPSDIPAYANSQNFKNECSALNTWQNAAPGRIHTSGESGLRRRSFDAEGPADVVRRSESAGKQFLNFNGKRGLGDGYKPRHMRK